MHAAFENYFEDAGRAASGNAAADPDGERCTRSRCTTIGSRASTGSANRCEPRGSEVAHESWLLAAAVRDQRRAGRARRGAGTRSGRARRSSRVDASADTRLAEIDRFCPRRGQPPRRAEPRGVFRGLRFVKAMRYAHLAALRHRRRVSLGFVEAGVLIAGADLA